jgi:hypothetical protein
MRQLAIATQNYQVAKQKFPSGGISAPGYPQREISLHVMLLPYVEQRSMKELAETFVGGSHASYNVIAQNKVSLFLCPSSNDDQFGDTYVNHYYGVQGPIDEIVGPLYNGIDYPEAGIGPEGPTGLSGIFSPKLYGTEYWDDPRYGTTIDDIADGLSNTFLFGEISWPTNDGAQYRPWTCGPEAVPGIGFNWGCKPISDRPINSRIYDSSNRLSFGSNHPAGCNFVRADCSTTFVPSSTDMAVLYSLCSCDSGELNTNTD